MTTGAFLIARLSSSRLPAKNIKKIMGRPMMEQMIERVRQAESVDKIVITTSDLPSDDPLEELACKLGVNCYRGPLDNVMERICGAAATFECDTIVELLGDNPLVHSDLIDQVVALYKEEHLEYAANITKEYPVQEQDCMLFPLGIRVQAYSLSVAQRYSDYPEYMNDETRGYTAFIFEHLHEFKVGYIEARGKWAFMNRPHLNFAVNYPWNFDAVRIIFERCSPEASNFDMKAVFDLLDQERYLYHQLG